MDNCGSKEGCKVIFDLDNNQSSGDKITWETEILDQRKTVHYS
jgi:hypothetical protein